MNTNKPVSLEIHSLQLPYASHRLHPRAWVDQLRLSIEAHGQLVPVIVIPKGTNQWILMDGYLRINALKRMAQDTINAHIWDCDVIEGLLRLLREQQSRSWEIWEETLLLQELHSQHHLSLNDLGKRIGRDKSWVSRRLALLDYLPESILPLLTQSKISLWAATRIIAPLARANTAHGECVLAYLLDHSHSTRELQRFYGHYQAASREQRTKLVNDIGLFFKAQKWMAVEKDTKQLQAGPEGQWQCHCLALKQALLALVEIAPTLFKSYQDQLEQSELINLFNSIKPSFDALTHTMRSLTHET